MRKALEIDCLMIVLTLLILAVVGPASQAQAQPAVHIRLGGGSPPSTVVVDDKPYFGVCPSASPPLCDDTVMRWRLVGNPIGEHQIVRIEDAPAVTGSPQPHLKCFPEDIPMDFTQSSQNPQATGTPASICTLDEKGLYWPYIVRLIEVDPMTGDETEIDSTDPGGIIHP